MPGCQVSDDCETSFVWQRSSCKAFVVQFAKFGLVGVSNTLLALAIYYALVLGFGAHYMAGNTVAFALSVLNAYYWNKRFVFNEKSRRSAWQLARIYASYGFTFLLSTGTLFIMVDVFGISHIVAPVLNLAITVPANFLLNKFWVFR